MVPAPSNPKQLMGKFRKIKIHQNSGEISQNYYIEYVNEKYSPIYNKISDLTTSLSYKKGRNLLALSVREFAQRAIFPPIHSVGSGAGDCAVRRERHGTPSPVIMGEVLRDI